MRLGFHTRVSFPRGRAAESLRDGIRLGMRYQDPILMAEAASTGPHPRLSTIHVEPKLKFSVSPAIHGDPGHVVEQLLGDPAVRAADGWEPSSAAAV